MQVVDELLAYWTLEGTEDTLEELEETLIVRRLELGGTGKDQHPPCEQKTVYDSYEGSPLV